AHNEYLQWLVELGLPVGLLICVGFLYLLKGKPEKGRPGAARASLLSLGIAALFNPIFHMPALVGLALLMAAMAATVSPRPKVISKISSSTFRWVMGSGIAVAIFLLIVVGIRAAWANQGQWQRIVRLFPMDASAWHALGNQTDDISLALQFHTQ